MAPNGSISQTWNTKRTTEAVRRRPFSVVLFDEIEKAHTDVFNVLLQVMDDGRLTDGHGRTVDFKNTVIIMTSNVGSQWINQPGLAYEEMRVRVMEAMQASFRPEFLNRVDDALIFHQLSQEHLQQIVNIQLRGLQKRLAERHIDLGLSLYPSAGTNERPIPTCSTCFYR